MAETCSDEDFWEEELRRFLPDARSALGTALGYVCCPICHVLVDVPFSYFALLPGRWASEQRLRDVVCQAGGFCNRHTWQLSRMQGFVTIARVFLDVLDAVPHQPMPRRICPLCRLEALMEEALLEDLCHWLSGKAAQEHYGEVFGVCYPHLEQLLQRETAEGVRELLTRAQEGRREELLRDLESRLDKDIAEARGLCTKAERRAPHRTLRKLAGDQGP
jgi:hypothetical protein